MEEAGSSLLTDTGLLTWHGYLVIRPSRTPIIELNLVLVPLVRSSPTQLHKHILNRNIPNCLPRHGQILIVIFGKPIDHHRLHIRRGYGLCQRHFLLSKLRAFHPSVCAIFLL